MGNCFSRFGGNFLLLFWPLCVFGHISAVIVEGANVRNCRAGVYMVDTVAFSMC
jgi:hypothetical protein